MAIVVAPYNPWRENLATQLLGNVASNYLQNQRASETAKKWGALVGLYQMQGQDQDAATINRMVEQQRLKSQEDAAVRSLVDRQAQVGMTGVPKTNVQEYIQSGLSGATRQPLNPEIGQWNTPEGVAVSDALANRVIGSYTPPSEAETADWNINSYNSGMAGRIPLQFTPEGVFAKAAETPNFDFKGMINALSDPRFAPYATELMKNIDVLQGIYDKRRNSNYLDMEAAAKANMAAYQGNMVARHAQDLPAWSTALSSRFAGPADPLVEGSKSNQTGFFEGLGNQVKATTDNLGDRMHLSGVRYAADQNLRGQLDYNAAVRQGNSIQAQQLAARQSEADEKKLEYINGKATQYGWSWGKSYTDQHPEIGSDPVTVSKLQDLSAGMNRYAMMVDAGIEKPAPSSALPPLNTVTELADNPALAAELLLIDKQAIRKIEKAAAGKTGREKQIAIIGALDGMRLGNYGIFPKDERYMARVAKALYPSLFK